MDENPAIRPDAVPAVPEFARFVGVIRILWRRIGWRLSPDVYEDCVLEAALLLWRVRDKLAACPDGDRDAYGEACVRRVVWRFLRRELEHHGRQTTLDVLDQVGGCATPLEEPASSEWAALRSDQLLDLISQPGLEEA